MTTKKTMKITNRYDFTDYSGVDDVFQGFSMHRLALNNLTYYESFDLVLIPGQEYFLNEISMIGLSATSDFLVYLDNNETPFISQIFQRGANGYPFNVKVRTVTGARQSISIRVIYAKREEQL